MIDINVKSVNEQFIFYDDDTFTRSTKDKLTELLQTAKENIIFYDRMYDEINVYVDRQETIVNRCVPVCTILPSLISHCVNSCHNSLLLLFYCVGVPDLLIILYTFLCHCQ